MSRLLVLGYAPLPGEPSKIQRSGNLRTWHFVKPLLDAGHAIRLLGARSPGSTSDDLAPEIETHDSGLHEGSFHYVSMSLERFHDDAVLQAHHDAFAPDAVIGVNSHPAARAVALDTDAPIWCDLNGWALAEAQTKAATYEDDAYLSHFWNMESAILDRADVISTVSRAQAHATVGELALRGRLSRRTVGYEFCHPIPNALVDHPYAPRPGLVRGRLVPEDAFVVLWVGGYNTWTDIDLLVEALTRAMDTLPDLHFVSTGGALVGHDEVTFEHFRQRMEVSPLAERTHFAGWVPTADVPSFYAEADLGLNVDKASYETTFGARNRINDFLKVGLPVLTTRGTEISQDLAAQQLALTVDLGDARGFAEQIRWAHGHRDALRFMGRQASEFAHQTYSYSATTQALCAWAAKPHRAPDQGDFGGIDDTVDFFRTPPNGTLDPQALKRSVNRLEHRCHDLEDQLAHITHSKMWRFWMTYLRLRGWLGFRAAPSARELPGTGPREL